VGDVVAAALAAAESTLSGPVNIGTGVETDVLALATKLGELGDREFEPEFEPARPGEVQRIALDPGRAERELGWRAETGLDEGLRLTLASL
jgi:UDP-glucose 4-epimerase